MAASAQLSFADLEAVAEPGPTIGLSEAEAPRPARRPLSGSADRAALAALEAALADARASEDDRPPLVVLASCLGQLGVTPGAPSAAGSSADRVSLRQARDDWLRRLETSQKSQSAIVAYRVAIDDLLDWSEANGQSVLEEATIVDYLSGYQQRAHPAPATYYRRFLLLRRFLRWVSRRDGACDPFLDLEPPPKPRQERDWLTREEFRRLLDAAGRPERNLPGLARARPPRTARARDDGASPLRALCARVARPRARWAQAVTARPLRQGRQAAPPTSADRPGSRTSEAAREPTPELADPVFCGLAGGRLQQTTLADIIRRAATRAGISKHVTAHTLAPHRRDLAASGARRHPPRRRVPRPRRSLDRRALRTRRPRRALRRGGTAGAAGYSVGGTGRGGLARGSERRRRFVERVGRAAPPAPSSPEAGTPLSRGMPRSRRLVGHA